MQQVCRTVIGTENQEIDGNVLVSSGCHSKVLKMGGLT